MPAPLFLVGFMAAGKTAAGRALAQATGRRFVDLDEVLAIDGAPAGAQAAADLEGFRRREAAALADLIARGVADTVVATGGGAATFGDNLARMRAAGLVVALDVEAAEARRRAAGGPPRPLLADAEALAAARAPAYRRAAAVVDTTGRALAEVVAEVAAVERAWDAVPAAHRPEATLLALGARTYPIVPAPLDAGLLAAALPGVRRVAVVSDSEVAPRWAAPVMATLEGAGVRPDLAVVPAGEASKSLATYGALCERLIALGLDRGAAVVALGGGVVGDLAGFVAATLLRGLPVVQLPTTLVAMTDAAIGGKTAIDLPAGKNLLGAFWQPRLVACDAATLATLPARERRAGFGELWKYALLDGEALWAAVEACAAWGRAGEGAPPPPGLADVVARAVAYKAALVSRDERETRGHRALLNLGHTVGHAIETAADGALRHGEAVALGLVAACRVSAALGGADLEPRLVDALRGTGLDADVEPWLTAPVLDRLGVDKKRAGDDLGFVVVRAPGRCEVVRLPLTELRRILRPRTSP